MDGNGESEVTVTSEPHHKKLELNTHILYPKHTRSKHGAGLAKVDEGQRSQITNSMLLRGIYQ